MAVFSFAYIPVFIFCVPVASIYSILVPGMAFHPLNLYPGFVGLVGKDIAVSYVHVLDVFATFTRVSPLYYFKFITSGVKSARN